MSGAEIATMAGIAFVGGLVVGYWLKAIKDSIDEELSHIYATDEEREAGEDNEE